MNKELWTREERERHQAEFDRYDGGSMIVPNIDEMRRILATVEALEKATHYTAGLLLPHPDSKCDCPECATIRYARALLAALEGKP